VDRKKIVKCFRLAQEKIEIDLWKIQDEMSTTDCLQCDKSNKSEILDQNRDDNVNVDLVRNRINNQFNEILYNCRYQRNIINWFHKFNNNISEGLLKASQIFQMFKDEEYNEEEVKGWFQFMFKTVNEGKKGFMNVLMSKN